MNITCTKNFTEIAKCNIIYIAQDVATDAQGKSNIDGVNDLIVKVLAHINATTALVIHNQIPPGFTRKLISKFNAANLFYHVETLIFGQALERAMHPERIIIGKASNNTKLTESLQHYLNLYDCPKFEMVYESAELTKIAINLFLISQVTTTNTLAEMCEKIGANWHDIIPTLQKDKRIGEYAYLKPGLGLSGGNLERDLTSAQDLSKKMGTFSSHLTSQEKDSDYRISWIQRTIKSCVDKPLDKLTIGIVGVTYKIGTHAIKNSPSIKIMKIFSEVREIYAFDPFLDSEIINFPARLLDKPGPLFEICDVVILMHQYDDIAYKDFENYTGIIIDMTYQYTRDHFKKATVIHMGESLKYAS